jgi:hypothetical protein
MLKLIISAEQACANILRFEHTLKNNTAVQARLSYARAWYACQDERDAWCFAPAKFAGYQDIDVNEYLDGAAGETRDGRRTEAQLRMFFDDIGPDASIHGELTASLFAFLAKYDKSPSVKARVHVLKTCKSLRRNSVPSHKIATENLDAVVELIIAVSKILPAPQYLHLLSELTKSSRGGCEYESTYG